MIFWNALLRRLGDSRPEHVPPPAHWLAVERPAPDLRRVLLLIGLGSLSWVATYVGMLELIQANLGDLPVMHKVIVGFSCAMLMIMIVWLLDRMFSPVGFGTRLSYIAGYLFLSIISVGFGFGFYWKVLEILEGAGEPGRRRALGRRRHHAGAGRFVRGRDPARAATVDPGPAHRDLKREGGKGAHGRPHLPQQWAGRRATPQGARRRRGALQVRVRFRQGPHRRG
jgi:hypothetical protein